MQVSVGYSDSPDSKLAGKKAAQEALDKANRNDDCSLVFLFSTARHNQKVLRDEVAALVGSGCPIYGGGAVGVITNEKFGYAGDQVGVACIWLQEAEFSVFTEYGLLESEAAAGERLGKQLANAGVEKDSSVMLFYDAVDQTKTPMRLLMATWILEGIEKGLGFLPDLTGAGMQGDHICTPTQQYLGDTMGDHSAFALAFSDEIRIDNVIMHGCRPASPYYTVTKAEGPVILEINNTPAIAFMEDLFDSAITPEEYPFFLLFGINHSERFNDFDEENYASRLCLGIDKERGGIVMFEPDMVAGTKFQVMFRSLGLDYMAPKLEELYAKLEDREPLFAMYIDCAGRCAGYGGVDIEDAYVVQDAANKLGVPLLGLYTGVEIASIGGKPRGLDWTGVFCVFSKSKDGKITKKEHDVKAWNVAEKNTTEVKLETEDLRKLAEQNIAKVLELDTGSIAIRHELEQKRRGFSLLAELAVSLRQGSENESIFFTTTQRLNATLNMQKTIVLVPDAEGKFIPSVLQGYGIEEKAELAGKQINLEPAFLDISHPVLVTGADDAYRFADLREKLHLPYFVSTPVVIENKVAAVLVTGRMMEAPPFLSRLGHNDVETLQAISALLSSVLVYQRLDDANKLAQTDVLTGLYNRRALEVQSSALLKEELAYGRMFAFIMIDIDHFKQINDQYGHIVGDEALEALAQALRSNFRATDVVSRLGGDEFAVFCTMTGDVEQVKHRAEQLIERWAKTPIVAKDGTTFSSTLSIGISVAPRDGVTYNELLHKADIALYKSKQNGRNQYTLYDVRMMEEA